MVSRRLTLVLLAVIGTASSARLGAQQTPTFRAGVDLVAVDVQVVTGNGMTITGLGPDKFQVSINGRRRRVVSAELVRLDTATAVSSADPQPAGSQPAGPGAAPGNIAPAPAAEGRVYIIAIDLLSFRPGATQLIASSARGFIEKLQPTDLVGLAAFPAGPEIDASTDHAAVISGLEKVVGAGEPAITAANRFGLNPHNIVDITAASQIEPWVDISTAPPNSTIRRVGEAVCAYDNDPENCARWIVSDARSLAVYEEGLAIQRLGALRALLSALARAPGRKTLVFLSAGFPATDVPGGRPDIGELGLLVGQEAARANTTIYSLHVDSRRMEMASAESGRMQRPTDNQSRDSAILSRPLDQISALSGGAIFTVAQGGGESAFDRIRSETSSLYMLGVEPDDSDRTGAPRQLSVRVNSGQRGAIVRARTWVVVPRPGSAPVARANVRVSTPPPAVAAPPPTTEDLLTGAASSARPAGAASATAAATEPSPAPRTAVDELFATYSSGDRGIVIRELGSPAGFERVRPDLVSTLARWRREWSPDRAAFALEVALTAFARGWPNPPTYLNAARDIVVARPDAPGAAPDHDAFELGFHRAAVALLAALDGPNAVDAYLASIQHRVAVGDTVPATAVLTDARLLLARAAAREVQTLRLLASAGSDRDDPWAWAVAKDDGTTRRQLEEVDALLDRASTDDDTRAEASVRRAFIRHRLGQHQNALVLLTAAVPTDPVVIYWRALIQGRILVALGREQDAIGSFERASAQAPDAPTPAIALSTIFLKRGDRKLAFDWAGRARTTNENGVDPWPLYWGGAARFLAPWVTDLRDHAR